MPNPWDPTNWWEKGGAFSPGGNMPPVGPLNSAGPKPTYDPSNFNYDEYMKEWDTWKAAGGGSSPEKDTWNWLRAMQQQAGDRLGMFDTEAIGRFMNMPRYNANEERRGITQGFEQAVSAMPSVTKTLRGLAPDLATQENAVMRGMAPLAGGLQAANAGLYEKQHMADMNWMENFTNLLTQRMNLQGGDMDRLMQIVMALENIKLQS